MLYLSALGWESTPRSEFAHLSTSALRWAFFPVCPVSLCIPLNDFFHLDLVNLWHASFSLVKKTSWINIWAGGASALSPGSLRGPSWPVSAKINVDSLPGWEAHTHAYTHTRFSTKSPVPWSLWKDFVHEFGKVKMTVGTSFWLFFEMLGKWTVFAVKEPDDRWMDRGDVWKWYIS